MEVFYKVISAMETKDIVTNRRAYHDYEILQTLESGIILLVRRLNPFVMEVAAYKSLTSKLSTMYLF